MKTILVVLLIWIICALVVLVLRTRRVHEEQQRLDELIRVPIYRDEFRKADEALPLKAALRRAVADRKRIEASKIESGAEIEKRIQLVVRH